MTIYKVLYNLDLVIKKMKKIFLIALLFNLMGQFNTVNGQAIANSKEPLPLDSTARVARLQKSIEKLTNDLKNVSNDGKSPATIHFLIAMDEVGLKRYADAIKEFSLAIKMNPEMKQAYLYRGAAHEMLRDYELAITDYKTCLPDFKDNVQTSARLYSGIGKLQGMLKKYEDAVQSESTAISLAPFYNEAYLFRAMRMLKMVIFN